MAKKLLLDTDGVGIPLKSGRILRLEEPTVAQLKRFRLRLKAADAKLDEAAGIDPQERADVSWDEDGPYLAALIETIEEWNGEKIDPGEFFGWAATDRTLSRIFNHCTDPLGGSVSPFDQLATMLQSLQGQAAVPSPSSNGTDSEAPNQPVAG